MKTFAVAAVFTALLSHQLLLADFDPAEWKNQQEFQVDKTGIIKMVVPVETLDAAQENLSDLRLIDEQGKEVPYAIERVREEPRISRKAVNLRTNLEKNSTTVTCTTDIQQPIDSLLIATPANQFIKPVKIESSNNGKDWKTITEGQPIFRQLDGRAGLQLYFPPETCSQLRLTLDDSRDTPIPISGIQLFAAGKTTPGLPFQITEVSRSQSAGETRIMLRAEGAHVTLVDLTVATPEPFFTRHVSLLVSEFLQNEARENVLTRGVIFRIQDGKSPANLSFAKDTTLPTREFTLLIQNQDNPPLQITKVTATRRPLYLVFSAAKTGAFRLMTGNAQARAPRYDLGSLLNELPQKISFTPSVTALKANPAWNPREPLPEIPMIGSGIDVSGWKFRKHLKIDATGIQQLELDPELLSQTRSSLNDLRLVTENKQIPYILERTTLLKSIKPSTTSTDDPKKPSVSRWTLKLPHTSLPISRLTCTTSSPVFKRTALLLEEVQDHRGISLWQNLGTAFWVRTSGRDKIKLVMDFYRPPTTDCIVLEMDNGDNPPLKLDDFETWYPVTRILFKASANTDAFLYYVNPKVGTPQYDIALVAGQILSSEKVTATLEKEERMDKAGWSENPKFKSAATPIFWAVLVLVVAGLIFVMARLLPKNPA